MTAPSCQSVSTGDHQLRINQDHLYHGAALTQIAEHEQFTAINAVRVRNRPHRSAFRINDTHCVYLKYATKPTKPYNEYIFTFQTTHLDDLRRLSQKCDKLFLALICVQDHEICLISYETLLDLIARRRNAKGSSENQYTLLVFLKSGGKFRINMNLPNRRKHYVGNSVLIARKEFPNRLFEP